MTHLPRALLIFALALIAGGYSESTTVMLMWLPLVVPSFRRWLLVAWWLGLGIALAFMVFTPGAMLRAQYNGVSHLSGIAWAWLTTWLLVPERWLGNPLGLVLVALVGYLYPVAMTGRMVARLWLVALGCLLATMLLVVRGNGGASVWTLSLPMALVVVAAWASGAWWGLQAKRKVGQVSRYGTLALWATMGILLTVTGVMIADRGWLAIRWQIRDAAIRGGLRVVSIHDDRDSFSPPLDFSIECLRVWYGVDKLIVE